MFHVDLPGEVEVARGVEMLFLACSCVARTSMRLRAACVTSRAVILKKTSLWVVDALSWNRSAIDEAMLLTYSYDVGCHPPSDDRMIGTVVAPGI